MIFGEDWPQTWLNPRGDLDVGEDRPLWCAWRILGQDRNILELLHYGFGWDVDEISELARNWYVYINMPYSFPKSTNLDRCIGKTQNLYVFMLGEKNGSTSYWSRCNQCISSIPWYSMYIPKPLKWTNAEVYIYGTWSIWVPDILFFWIAA
jgi:hypothetical protein